ncbi:3-methyl-2-oxobutanoate hydroxymethyltransferase [Vibrio sp. S4M6]|uniref:3-methyl-2-oxobutanoate hydroxymethyltransferase n=1 Tax=Vibrio sinus TaxID=2946865 RepID=UPI002029D332|nr:3-methyl-2-oxobutanoate hydroxymethyltransferase [Vibrio sinus]MCL9781641.1 3-methyl-2-oxobutanoate hydroxymethyltransferase [Vibrio sinus]
MKLLSSDLLAMKGATPISMLTAYTCPVARCVETAGVAVILVGDTVGMVEMGFESTRDVTMEHIEYHVGAVRRGAPNTHIIGDLPYQADKDPDTALVNANRLIAAGADSVKLEGAKVDVIRHLVSHGIPVVGHTGLTPQTAKSFKKVGNTSSEAEKVKQEARKIQQAGAFMLVLEHIPHALAGQITQELLIPTIGIGAGSECDGQVLVINDALGLGVDWPPFSKQFVHISETITKVARDYREEVEGKAFPRNLSQLIGAQGS